MISIQDYDQLFSDKYNKAIKSHYDVWIQQIILFLKGKDTHVIKQLQQDMASMSAALKFEKAAQLRDSITNRWTCRELRITQFTPVMGAHSGPGVLGVAFRTL